VVELVPGEKVVAIKNVSANEEFFNGHFPGRPVMPGVLQIEGLAQTGAFLIAEEMKGKIPLFAGIEKAKFRRPVVPGDQLRFEVELTKQRRNICWMSGKGYVGDEVAVEADLTAMAVDQEAAG
jgi:beta-hydroxyacyl-ACP dehydratase FabZ